MSLNSKLGWIMLGFTESFMMSNIFNAFKILITLCYNDLDLEKVFTFGNIMILYLNFSKKSILI